MTSTLLTTHFTLRHWRSAWKSTLLLTLILALGVGVFLAIRLANRAALTGFNLFTETVTGESDLILRAPSGDLPVALLHEIRNTLDPLPVALFPIVESTAAEHSARNPAPAFQLLGIDLVALPNIYYLGNNPSATPINPGAATFDLASPNHASISQRLANNRRLTTGDRLNLIVDDQIVEITVASILPNTPLRAEVPENLLLFDLPGLQQLLGTPDTVSRVELRIPVGRNRDSTLLEAEERLRNFAQTHNLLVETPTTQKASASQMTAAFRLNLTVLSTLALLVGTYLVLQALEAAVVRRREEIAILRSLGVTPSEIRRAWLIESLVLGAVGSTFGILLGWGMAQFAVGSIARTVNTLYYQTTTDAATLHPIEATVALCFGLISSLIAGYLPARDAAATPPAQALRTGQRHQGMAALRLPWLGVAIAVAAVFLAKIDPIVIAAGTRVPLGGYLAALAWVLAISILAGLLFRPISAVIRRFRGSPAALYAASHLRRPTSRHRLTVAGLITAIGMAAGMGILIHSFETTLTSWINQLLRADLYITTGGVGNASNDNQMRPSTWQTLTNDPDVAAADILRLHEIDFRGRPVQLGGTTYTDPKQRLQFSWIKKPEIPQLTETSTWINEPLALRYDLGQGDEIDIPTPLGEKKLTIHGVYADYGNESGTLLVDRSQTSAWFGEENVSNLALYLREEADPDFVRARLAAQFPALVIRTNEKLRTEAIRIFRQTFSVTYALKAIGIGVAITGLGLALTSLLLERRREITTLKSLGYDRRGVARACVIESVGLSAVGALGGIVLSLLLGYLLIYVINRQSFGWTLQFSIPWLSIFAIFIVTLITAAAVAWPIGMNATKLRAEQEE